MCLHMLVRTPITLEKEERAAPPSIVCCRQDASLLRRWTFFCVHVFLLGKKSEKDNSVEEKKKRKTRRGARRAAMSTGGERGEPGGLRRSNRIRKAAAKDSHALSDGDAPVQSDGDIGAPWTKDEVTKFYNGARSTTHQPSKSHMMGSLGALVPIGVREHGTAWKKIASELKNRTPEMVAALYQQYSGYLSLSPEHSSALVTIPLTMTLPPSSVCVVVLHNLSHGPRRPSTL